MSILMQKISKHSYIFRSFCFTQPSGSHSLGGMLSNFHETRIFPNIVPKTPLRHWPWEVAFLGFCKRWKTFYEMYLWHIQNKHIYTIYYFIIQNINIILIYMNQYFFLFYYLSCLRYSKLLRNFINL